MKGITPVVAIILLLLITIAVVGFAFTYFQTVMTSTGEAAQQQADVTTDMLAKSARINVADASNFALQNIGSKPIAASEFKVYVNGGSVTCAIVPDPVPIGSAGTCTLGTACNDGDNITLSFPAGTAKGTCPI